jgi:hypothetical protein
MKPSWSYSPKDDEFEIKGCWKRLLDEGGLPGDDHIGDWSTKKLQVLILRQLCKITVWLVIIVVCQITTVCVIY